MSQENLKHIILKKISPEIRDITAFLLEDMNIFHSCSSVIEQVMVMVHLSSDPHIKPQISAVFRIGRINDLLYDFIDNIPFNTDSMTFEYIGMQTRGGLEVVAEFPNIKDITTKTVETLNFLFQDI